MSVIDEMPQEDLYFLVHPFCLSIGSRMICCCGKSFYSQDLVPFVDEFGYKGRSSVADHYMWEAESFEHVVDEDSCPSF